MDKIINQMNEQGIIPCSAEDIIDYVEEKGEIKKEIDEPNLNNDDYELEI